MYFLLRVPHVFLKVNNSFLILFVLLTNFHQLFYELCNISPSQANTKARPCLLVGNVRDSTPLFVLYCRWLAGFYVCYLIRKYYATVLHLFSTKS